MRQLWTETGRLAVITNKADNWEMRTILNGYEDIINKSRPVNNRHKRMSNYERAAQFSPFAALTGLGAAISETARLTDEKVEQDEEQLNILNNKYSQPAGCDHNLFCSRFKKSWRKICYNKWRN